MGRPKADFERVFGEVAPQVAAVVEWARRAQTHDV